MVTLRSAILFAQFALLAISLPVMLTLCSPLYISIKPFHFDRNLIDFHVFACFIALVYIILAHQGRVGKAVVASYIVLLAIFSIVKLIFLLKRAHEVIVWVAFVCTIVLSLLPVLSTQIGPFREALRKDLDYKTHYDPLLEKVESGVRSDAADGDESRQHATTSRLVMWAYPEWRLLACGTVMLFISSTASLAQPLFFGKIIGSCSRSDSSREELNRYCLILVCIFVVGGISTSLRGWLFTLVGERLVRNVRSDLFDAIVKQDIAFFDKNKTGELMNRLSSDTAVIQSCLSVNISMGLRAAGQVFVSMVLLFITSWELTLVMIAVVPALVGIAVMYGRFTKKLTKDYQDALAKAAETGSESISNVRIMRSFGADNYEMKRYHDHINFSYEKGARKAMAYGYFVGGITFLANSVILVVIYYGAILVTKGQLDVGSLTSFILYTIYIALGLAELSSLFTEFMNALGASERIFCILDTEPLISTKGGGVYPRLHHQGVEETVNSSDCCKIEFKDVVFHYPLRPDVQVLNGFNLTVLPGQTVALVGASGSGKSTALCLLERFYDTVGGSITIDGVEIRDLAGEWLHRAISIVPQEPVLFSGSIRSNIIYSRLAQDPSSNGCEVSDVEVEWAGKQANAHDFIMSFPEGYDTAVGERGVRLSGGQKQRIAIARALLSNPKILLLDEATSALDSESEQLVQDAIDKLMLHRTVVVIAHRLSTVRDADMIAVCGQGRVLAAGTHEELMASSETYCNLVRKQLQWGSERNDSTP